MTKEPKRVQPRNAAAPPPPQEAPAVAMDSAPREEPKAPEPEMTETAEMQPDEITSLYKKGFQRVPFGDVRQKLDFPPPPEGFRQYVFNDWPGRIEAALAAGYKHREDEGGKIMKRPVGVHSNGGVMYGYLMMIPEQWWKEDHARGQARVDEIDRAVRGGGVAAEGEDAGGRYVPEEGIIIRETQTGDPYS